MGGRPTTAGTEPDCGGFSEEPESFVGLPPKARFRPTKPLVSYQSNRQFSGWNLPPLVIRAFGAHCKILDAHAVKPHRIRYYLERRDPEFEEKMAHVLCIYREVEILKAANACRDRWRSGSAEYSRW